MSKDKITPKNLHYDTSLPPFLARLQAQNTNQDRRQDYHAARPKKPRDEEADREDEPVYFDEKSGETLTKGEWEEREKFEGGGRALAEEGDGEGEKKTVDGNEDEKEKEKEKLAAIGGARKRKAGKVIGSIGDDEEQEAQEERPAKKITTDKKTTSGTKTVEGKKGTTKTAKKAKKVALSFGDDE